MKKLFLMLSFAGATMFTFGQGAQAQPAPGNQVNTPAVDPNAPDIKWESTTIDYGTVTKGDESNATRWFKFSNIGKSPLIISSCHGSCGCTVPTCPQSAIAPGAKDSIKVHYDINRVGQFTKTVTVASNAKTPNETLKIQGVVHDPNAGQAMPNTQPTPANQNHPVTPTPAQPH